MSSNALSTPSGADPGDHRRTVAATAKAMENHLFELYNIENAPDVRMTEDGPQYYDAEIDDPELTRAIADAEKRFNDYLREHRTELEGAREWTEHYAELDRREEESRTPAAWEADNLADCVRFYEDSVARAPQDRSYDFAVHMTDPTASADDFYANRERYVAGMEAGLASSQDALDKYLREHSADLAADPVWGSIVADLDSPASNLAGESVASEVEQGKVLGQVGNRVRLEPRDAAEHPDREVYVGWDRSSQSYFAQVFDGIDAEGEDRLLLDVGGVGDEITDTGFVLDSIRPYAATPQGLGDRLTGQRLDEAREHAAAAELEAVVARGEQSQLPRVYIGGNVITSDATQHHAMFTGEGWQADWLPGRRLSESQATAAVCIAAAPHREHEVSQWAAHLGMSVAEVGERLAAVVERDQDQGFDR